MRIIDAQGPAAVVVLLGIALVGYIDYATGIEVRVFPLYFLPLIAAANAFGLRGAVVGSILASFAWFAANAGAGLAYSHAYVLAVNLVSQGTAFLAVSVLIARLRDSLARERMLSGTDALTGLMNSRAFHEQAGAALRLCHRHRRPATLAFLDLDNFKSVNDTGGHQAGDELLVLVAQTISRAVRASDLVARMSGDEFVIFLPETDGGQAGVALEKIRHQLTGAEKLRLHSVSVSIGAVVCSVATSSLTEMLREADAQMYEVKAAGRNAVRIGRIPMQAAGA